jgi:putative isomerase
MVDKNDYMLIRNYLMDNIYKVLKKPYECFKYPFIDPGSVYDGNLWDWDSFWAVYSLINVSENVCQDEKFKKLLIEHSQGNVLNFLDFQLEDGYIPMMVESSKHSDPYLIMKHKSGIILNMHKPFLCQQICLVSGLKGEFSWIKDQISKLELYFKCYDQYYYNDKCRLYVWADDVMIGMDNDPATFGRPRFSTANIFLNSFMVSELKSMARILFQLNREDRAQYYMKKVEKLVESIQKECWDNRDKFFYSVDVDIKTRDYDWFHKGLGVFWNTLPIKIRAWSGFIPLWANIASKEQAEDIVKLHISDEGTFKSPFGIRSLARDEKMYNLTATNNPSNWLGPIWIIVNYIVFRGLLNYGYIDEAKLLCEQTLELLGNDLRKTGTLHEYYVPETGEPVMNGGFINWNILALNMVDELKGNPSVNRYLYYN